MLRFGIGLLKGFLFEMSVIFLLLSVRLDFFYISREAYPRGMYNGHGRLCVCLSVPRRSPTLLNGPGCNLGNGRGCSLVMDYWGGFVIGARGFSAMTT